MMFNQRQHLFSSARYPSKESKPSTTSLQAPLASRTYSQQISHIGILHVSWYPGRFVSNPNGSNVCENLQAAHSRPITEHLQLDTGEVNVVPGNSQLNKCIFWGSPVVCQRILHHLFPSHFSIIPLPKGCHLGISLEEVPGSNIVLERGVMSGRTVLMCSTTRLCVNTRNRY